MKDKDNLENKIKKYQIVDWVPVIGTLKLMQNEERWLTLINRNGQYSDFLYALSNWMYGVFVGGLGLGIGLSYVIPRL